MSIFQIDTFTTIAIMIPIFYFFSLMLQIINLLSAIHALLTYDNKRKYDYRD